MKPLMLITALLLLTPAAFAQELTLFEPVETDDAAAAPQQFPGSVTNTNGQPAYTVRSTALLGDSYKITLVDRQGKLVEVEWRPGERSPLPGAPDFLVEDIQQRSVVLSQPGSDPCVASPQQGVSCLDGSRAVLALTVAAPVAASAQGVQTLPTGPAPGNGIVVDPVVAAQNPFEAAILAQQAQAAQGLPVPVPGAQGVFINPFNGQTEVIDNLAPDEQAARDARQRARSERLNRIVESNRIPDDQIPAGMRRVTTPFGDRLVPVRE